MIIIAVRGAVRIATRILTPLMDRDNLPHVLRPAIRRYVLRRVGAAIRMELPARYLRLAKRLGPVDTGALRRSLRVTAQIDAFGEGRMILHGLFYLVYVNAYYDDLFGRFGRSVVREMPTIIRQRLPGYYREAKVLLSGTEILRRTLAGEAV